MGGGIIIDGELYRGAGYAGEMGYIIVDGGRYLEQKWQKWTKGAGMKKYMGHVHSVGELMNSKDKNSKFVLGKITNYLGQGIGSMINIFDPEIVILGGGVKEVGDRFLNLIIKEVSKYSVLPKKTEIKWTELEHPGILGAALYFD